MLNTNELSNISINELGLKNIKILNVEKANDFLFIVLDNDKRILTNGSELYDVSNYNHLSDLFNMGDKFCAVMRKDYSTYVVNLKTMEILYEDDKVYHIGKQDDRTLHVIMKIGGGNTTIYDIETKKYLPSPENYEFEKSLGNNLYVFREEHNSGTDFYDYRRCVINADGKVILKDIDGWIELCENYLIIKKRKELCIVKINKDNSLNMNTIAQKGELIAKPEYYEGHIIIMGKDLIKIFTPDLNLVNQFEIKELESVIDFEIISNILKLCLPYTIDGKKVNKHLFMNLKTGKSISHVRIDGYPYWTPDVYVGKDDLNDEQLYSFEYDKIYEQTEYHFYDSDFNQIVDVKGNFYSKIDDNIFVVGTWNGKKCQRKFINAKTSVVKECDYDVIKFSPYNLYGCAFNTITNMLDIVDRNLSVIIPNIDYKRLGLSKSNDIGGFNYFVVNDYVCIITHIAEGPRSFFRNIIQNANGEIILDSMQHKCYPMGNLIQIIKDGKSEFLNTLTGQIGQLSLTVPTDEDGKIDFSKIKDLTSIFQIEDATQLLLPSSDEQSPKVKKILPNTNKDD